jgi:hypothetical protein
MITINKMIVALYLRNKESMKFSDSPAILFISKLTFSLPIFVWLTFFISISERFLLKSKSILDFLPNGKYALWPIVILIYFIFNHFTWKIKEVLHFVDNELVENEMKKLIRVFWAITILGILLSGSIGYQNKWHSLP